MEESKKGDAGAEKRLQEAEKQQAEAKRALSVAMAKIAHASIEMVEKTRKQPLIYSLIGRIGLLLQNSSAYQDMLKEVQPTSPGWRDLVQSYVDNYKSIRKDIKISLEIKDFEELFPERPTYSETPTQAITIIGALVDQLSQLMMYLMRF